MRTIVDRKGGNGILERGERDTDHYAREREDRMTMAKPLDADSLGELARMLQAHTALCELSDMQVRGALELMQQRGWRIVRVDGPAETSSA